MGWMSFIQMHGARSASEFGISGLENICEVFTHANIFNRKPPSLESSEILGFLVMSFQMLGHFPCWILGFWMCSPHLWKVCENRRQVNVQKAVSPGDIMSFLLGWSLLEEDARDESWEMVRNALIKGPEGCNWPWGCLCGVSAQWPLTGDCPP